MDALAVEERFEEAALARERLSALSSALHRQRRLRQLVECERMVLVLESGERAELRRGVLWQVWAPRTPERPQALWGPDADPSRAVEMAPESLPGPTEPIGRAIVDELTSVASWLDRYAGRIGLESTDVPLTSALPALPRFEPRRRRG